MRLKMFENFAVEARAAKQRKVVCAFIAYNGLVVAIDSTWKDDIPVTTF